MSVSQETRNRWEQEFQDSLVGLNPDEAAAKIEYRDKINSVSLGMVSETTVSERTTSKDLDAYKSLRGEGLQPARVKGSHQRMMHADHVSEL